jgi:hypothetical protein
MVIILSMTLILKHSDFEAFHFVSIIKVILEIWISFFFTQVKKKGVTLGVKIGLEALLGFRS